MLYSSATDCAMIETSFRSHHEATTILTRVAVASTDPYRNCESSPAMLYLNTSNCTMRKVSSRLVS